MWGSLRSIPQLFLYDAFSFAFVFVFSLSLSETLLHAQQGGVSPDPTERMRRSAGGAQLCTYPSIATFFMIVSLPEDAAAATCCSMLLLIFALNS